MNIRKSELIIENFNLMGMNIVSFSGEDEFSENIVTNSNFDFDFDIFFNNEEENLFKIIVRIDNFNENQIEYGYGIDVFGEFKFRFVDGTNFSEKTKNILVSKSALPMAIAHLRSIVAITTSNFQYGSYFIPSIDMNDLLQKKIESLDVHLDE